MPSSIEEIRLYMEEILNWKSDGFVNDGKLKELESLFDVLLDSNNVESKLLFGIDPVIAYDCLVEFFKTYVPSSLASSSELPSESNFNSQ